MDTKRITRSHSDRLVAGVAGGLGAYFNLDPLIMRGAFLLLSLFNGLGVVIYVVLWLIIPNEGSVSEGRSTVQSATDEMQTMLKTLIERVRMLFQR